MRATSFVCSSLSLLLMAGCSRTASEPARSLLIQQEWQLQPGDTIAGHRVAGGLGDISIALNGEAVYAPADGRMQPIADTDLCVVFESPEIPAYLFRLCGIRKPKLGAVQRGDAIGTAEQLQFATLRRQPDGKWAMVEPSRQILEQALTR